RQDFGDQPGTIRRYVHHDANCGWEFSRQFCRELGKRLQPASRPSYREEFYFSHDLAGGSMLHSQTFPYELCFAPLGQPEPAHTASKSGRGRKSAKGARTGSPSNEVVTCPTVAIGSSAGGVSGLQTLFERMPADLGVAFVVVAHLEPSHPSELVPILQRRTSMPVRQVEETEPLQPNCVFV